MSDQIVVVLPFPGHPVHTRLSGHNSVVKRIGTTNNIISTADSRRSQQLCYLNKIQPYHARKAEGTADGVYIVDFSLAD